nr:13176_t:CDS:2 [Entrophospora candida]
MNSSEDGVSTSTFITRKSSSGRPEMQVWNHFNKTISSSRGHYAATCNYCEKIWARGKPDELQNHLASECDKCPETICDEFIEIISNWTTRLNDNKQNNINQQLEPANDSPSCTSISNTILNPENAQITIKINEELQKEENITIGCGLQDNIFRENCLFAGELLQKIGYNTSAVNCLIAHRYWLNKPPFDLGFDSLRDTPVTWWQTCVEKPPFIQTIALNLLSIVPHSANCERIFSVLQWFFGQRRSRLDPNQISKMARIHSYYISNSKNLLQYFGQELTSEQIEAQVVNATYHLTNSNEIEEDVPFASLSDDGDDELPQDSRTFCK